MNNILVDTGAWIAFADEADHVENRKNVVDMYELLLGNTVVVPWPIVYETLKSRMAKKSAAVARLHSEFYDPRIYWMDDTPYREQAMDLALRSASRGRPLSMVDCLLRLIMDDTNVKIEYLFTFNARDFSDVCYSRGIEIIS